MNQVFLKLLAVSLMMFTLIYADQREVTFKELTHLVSNDISKNIYLDSNLSNKTYLLNVTKMQEAGELYKFYRSELKQNDLKMKYYKDGNFYRIETNHINPHKQRKFYVYNVRKLSKEDAENVFKVFEVTFSFINNTKILYSATDQQYKQIQLALVNLDGTKKFNLIVTNK
ncbi:MAG: hypothetical protein U9N49_11330 [Campylobacterota bacterium]|nr:hypothetical protein [Campylobacterota bacterium]